MNPEMNAEYKAIIDDEKFITENIVWRNAPGRSPAQEFRVDVNYPDVDELRIQGWYNPFSGKLSYTIFIPSINRRIYGLDMGMSHTNPNQETVGSTHKNYWVEGAESDWAYEPQDITASLNDPVAVWRQFCAEANIRHTGTMSRPRPPIIRGAPI